MLSQAADSLKKKEKEKDIHAPGAQVRVHAVVHSYDRNYDDKDFLASQKEIRQNDDMHCSVQAFRLKMEWLPWRP